MTSAATALGTRLFGGYGEGAGKDKATYNQVKKGADAISAYVMSEGLWHLTRTLPENHAIMVSLGEGLMPKAGETPEMGANPLLGFGRVYARPEVARMVDRRVRRLLNEPGHTFEHFHGWLQKRGITLWGAAVDTLENTSRFAEGKATGPMAVFHLFDSPLLLSRPYESYMGCLTVPRRVAEAADRALAAARLPDPAGRRRPGDRGGLPRRRDAKNVHVWTLRGKSRAGAAGEAVGGVAGAGGAPRRGRAGRRRRVSRSSPTRARTPRRSSSEAGRTPRARRTSSSATATPPRPRRCRRPASPRCWTSTASMALFSPSFEQPCHVEGKLMQLDPAAPDFARKVAELLGGREVEAGKVQSYAEAIREAAASNVPLGRPALGPTTSFPGSTGRCWPPPATSATTPTRGPAA